MIPSQETLGKLKEQTHINAARLFCDACALYRNRSCPSAYALAIVALEEVGKLQMIDHICDDISMNPDSNPQDWLSHLFSQPVFLSHKNKQAWASDPIVNCKTKRLKTIANGGLDRAKQDALYVGYSKGRIRSPTKLSASQAYSELTIVLKAIEDMGDLGFNGFDCWSDAKSRAKGKRWLAKVQNEYASLRKPKKKP